VHAQAELVLAAKKLDGGYTTQSALDMLPPFHMDMGVGGVDSRPTCVIIRLTNPGQRLITSGGYTLMKSILFLTVTLCYQSLIPGWLVHHVLVCCIMHFSTHIVLQMTAGSQGQNISAKTSVCLFTNEFVQSF